MSTQFFRTAFGSVLAIAAPALWAATPVDGARFLDADAGVVESSPARELEYRAPAIEEVVARGTQPQREGLMADIREQVRVVNERLKASIETELKQVESPKPTLAGSS